MLLAVGCHCATLAGGIGTADMGVTNKKNAATRVWAATDMAITTSN